MTVQELIDKALSQGDNIPESDAAYVQRRRRALEFLREVVSEVWWSGEFTWKRREAPLTVPANAGQVVAPADYDDLGPYGDLYLMIGGIQQLPPLEERPESEIQDARSGNAPTTTPGIFAIFGQDAATFRDLIQLPINSVALSMRLAYMKTPPDLKDAGDPDETPGAPLTAANAALQEIPARFHVNVLLNGVKAKLRESKGDARWKKYSADYGAGLAQLKQQKSRFRSEHRRPPSFFGDR